MAKMFNITLSVEQDYLNGMSADQLTKWLVDELNYEMGITQFILTVDEVEVQPEGWDHGTGENDVEADD